MEAKNDPVTGVFSFTYDACEDPCSGATEEDCERYANREECVRLCDLQNLSDQQWLYCIHECRAPVEVIRHPVSFRAIFVISTNHTDTGQWHTFEVGPQEAYTPSFVVDTNMVWTGLPYYCYAYAILVMYNDGTTCVLRTNTWICNS